MASLDLFNDHSNGIKEANNSNRRESNNAPNQWFDGQDGDERVERNYSKGLSSLSQLSSKRNNQSRTALSSNPISFEWLPIEIIYRIFSFCDNRTLSALSGTCRRLYHLVNDDYVWRSKGESALVSNCICPQFTAKSTVSLSNRTKCVIESSWKRSIFQEVILLHNKKPLIPWLSIESRALWCTRGNTLYKFPRFSDGQIRNKPLMKLKCHQEDILKFKVKDNIIVGGSLDGSISVWNKHTGSLVAAKFKAHQAVINSIDCLHEKLIITGSKDRNAKIWSIDSDAGNTTDFLYSQRQQPQLILRHSININDRVLSVAVNETKDWAIIGSAGCTSKRPLYLFDVASNKMLGTLNDEHRHGAGVLGALWENESTLLSCGYDTLIRLWDIREANGKCVLKWEDPHDSAIYCLSSDHCFTILSGTCRYGVVRLWDKRKARQCIQMYYVSCENSPVYSLDFDPCYLYVALDKSINLLAFRGAPTYP